MNLKILIGVLILIAFISGCIQQDEEIPLADKDVFLNPLNYEGKTFRFQGYFEPHTCTMAGGECDIDHLGNCCDRIGNYGTRLGVVDLTSVPKEKLQEVRMTNETKYNVEVTGKIIGNLIIQRPVVVYAYDLKILGEYSKECTTDNDCTTGGCSGQLCGKKGEIEDIVTTCVWSPEYGCLEFTSCKCIENRCKWEETPEHQECMANISK